MGTGASANVPAEAAKAIAEATPEQLAEAAAGLDEEQRKKIAAALAEKPKAEAKVEAKAEAKELKALIVATSAAKMGDKETGAWSEEICGPYYIFEEAGYKVTVCSVAGGDVPIDGGSLSDSFKTENDKKMIEAGSGPLKGTQALASIDLKAADYNIVFFAGGHGTCVDFPTDDVGCAVQNARSSGKVIAAVCHGLMAFVKAAGPDGEPFVKGRNITCFSDAEEKQVGLDEQVPFLLEAKLKEQGGNVEVADAWAEKVVVDGLLVTGQNPQSSVACAKKAIEAAEAATKEKGTAAGAEVAAPAGEATEAAAEAAPEAAGKAATEE